MIAAHLSSGDGDRCPTPAGPRLSVESDTVTAPLDRTHLECLEARRQIRELFAAARARAATWTPTTPP